MTLGEIQNLLPKLIQGQHTPDEQASFELWLRTAPEPEVEMVMEQYYEGLGTYPFANYIPADFKDQITSQLYADYPTPIHRVHFLKTAWFRYAAVLLLVAGTATFLYKVYQQPPAEIVQTVPSKGSTDILPGLDKAVLTLAGGQQIRLDSSANVLLAAKGISNRDALIRYTNPPAIATMNTLTTPRGGQYKLQLADGTVVWLNAASSITYPTRFTEGKREVTVTGEVYFEVTANKEKPFIVKTTTDQIQVLGTSFNVNAYPDEKAVKTSLVQGSIKIGNTVLKPGEGFVSGRIVATNAAQDIAWKNGVFNFEGLEIKALMRQVARWYDVDVQYAGLIPAGEFVGRVNRATSLSNLLKQLENMGVPTKLDPTKRSIVVL